MNRRLSTLRMLFWGSVIVLVVCFAIPAITHAAGDIPVILAQAAKEAAKDGKSGTVITSTRSYWLEILIIIVMFGVTLFVVCRPSRKV